MKLLIKILFTLFILTNPIIGSDSDLGSTIPDLKIRLLDGSRTTIHKLAEDGPLSLIFGQRGVYPVKN